MTVILIAVAAVLILALILLATLCVRLADEMRPGAAQDLTLGGLEGTRFARYADTLIPDILSMRELPWEDVYISSFDGLKLHGRVVRGGGDAVILMHGYHSSPENDFAGIAQWYVRHGFTVIAADERSHGLSEGGKITFGTREQRDAVAWAQYAGYILGSERIWMHGASMGAVSSLLAMKDGYPEAVAGVIADCPFDSPGDLFSFTMKKRTNIPPSLFRSISTLSRAIMLGPEFANTSCRSAVAESGLPVLLFEGGGDHTVPPGSAESICGACKGRCTLVTIPEAKHTLCWQQDRETCAAALGKFIKENRDRQ